MKASLRVHGALAAIAASALAVPAWVVTHPPAIHHRPFPKIKQRVVPAVDVPPVEPVTFVDLAPEDARAYNDEVPFSTAPNPAARPFRFAGTADDRARATDCLAAAELYEAGDDAPGERAVAQVVLNRLRHPAFPKTVCGVVFEGAERATGCQFTFTCDGAMTRWEHSDAAWVRARKLAEKALSGSVYKPVGYATHYHTDWVVPYWQSSLDKVTKVGTHLFFRWSGWWGTPPAFRRDVSSDEPSIAALAAMSDAHRTGLAADDADAALAEASAIVTPPPVIATVDPDSILAAITRNTPIDLLPALAERACGNRPYCKYSAWSDRANVPASLPLTPDQIASMTFSYYRDRAAGIEKTLWNCQQIKRADPAQCMKVQTYRPQPAPSPTPPPSAGAPPPLVRTLPHPQATPAELNGVRRSMTPVAPTSTRIQSNRNAM